MVHPSECEQVVEREATTRKIGTIVYRAATTITVLELLAGGAADLANLRPVNKVMQHLGYPDYFTRILGFWKVLGAIALITPNHPRLREWAYAGTFFDLTGAAASHIARGNKASNLIAPLSFTAVALASRALQDFRGE